jgi:hypothetical protein
MVIAQQQPEKLTWRARFWRGMVSHKPLKKHIDWWLRGMAILAVPLIIGCTIVIGAELAAPDWFAKGIGLQVATITEDLLNAAIGHEREQMKATVQQIIDQQENRLQRMVENVLSNVRITEVNQTGQNGLFLPAGGEQPAPAMSYSSELQRPNSSLSTADYEDIENKEEDTKAATGQRDEDTKDERTPASDPDRTEDKLNLALHYIREHLAHVDDEDFDTQLAPVLGLKRSASARFWKLKVIELLKASGEYPVKQANSQESEQSTYERLLAYAHANPQVTQKELASILNVSERTIRRNLAAMRKSGQLPANWTSDEDTKAATNQQSGQNTGHTATDEDINIEDRTHRFRVVR